MGLFNSKPKVKPVVLLVLDGFGVAPESEGNAIARAKTPNYDRMLREYPHGKLIASGESVGLPANEVGNTEVGHLTMGVGRVIFQDLVRIDKAVESGDMAKNPALMAAIQHSMTNQSQLHVMGLVGTGKVHASMKHLYGLLEAALQHNLRNVVVHVFTDGRDSHPEAGAEVVAKLEEHLKQTGVGVIGSVMGRYYAMDRDRRWERIQLAYEALVAGQGEQGTSAVEVLKTNYANGVTDEFVKPTLILHDGQARIIRDNDAVVFGNFRVDRPKELTTALVLPEFENFRSYEAGFDESGKPVAGKPEWEATFQRSRVVQNLMMVTMTEYHKHLPVSGVCFPPQQVEDSLCAVIGGQGLKHLHMAESEKERFVKYYFNGMVEGQLPGQTDDIVASPKVATYDKKPEMSVHKLVKAFEKEIRKGEYSFGVMNFANPDMVAHTGNVEATIQAIEQVDKAIGKVEQAVLKLDGVLILTADHGNAEELKSFDESGFFYTLGEGGVNTEHSNNPVPVVVMSRGLKGQVRELAQGSLADVAPTVLKLLGLPVPEGMSGRDLLGDGGNLLP